MTTTEKQFRELVARFTPEIRDAFLAGVRELQNDAILRQMIEMIERNDVEGALRVLGRSTPVFQRISIAIASAFEQGALFMMAQLPKYAQDTTGLRTRLRFDIRDPRAERWLAEASAGLVTGLQDDIRQNVRDTLSTGLSEGRNPRSTALDVVGRYNPQTGMREGGVIGLSPQAAAWARSTRNKLLTLDESYFDLALRDKRFDAVVRAAIDSGTPLPAATVDKLVTRYRERALLHRGETIGRTETLAALNRSEYEAIKQALERNGLPMAAAKKVWDSAGDTRVRNSHRSLNNQERAMDEPFDSPTGAQMMHPGDTEMGARGLDVIDCRCRVRYIIDYAYGVD